MFFINTAQKVQNAHCVECLSTSTRN